MSESEVRQLPLHRYHEEAGARFAAFAGYEMPMRYSTIKAEHHTVRSGVGVFDVSHMGEVFVRGPEAVAAVNRLVTNNVGRLEDGQALYTAMCNDEGGIVDDLIIYRLASDELLLCVNAACRHTDVAWIRDRIEGDVRVEDESDEWVQLAVQGPKAMGVVGRLFAAACDLRPFTCAFYEFRGYRLLVARTGYTGEDGVEIYAPVGTADAIFEAVMEAGADDGIALIGLGARDTLRLEAKLLLYGSDMTTATTPLEAGLGWVVKFDVGDFIGRDALLAQRESVPRVLRCFKLEARGVLRSHYPIVVDGEVVGELTSGGIAPSLGDASIGLGYLPSHLADREEAEVEIRGRRLPLSVQRKPFYRRAAT